MASFADLRRACASMRDAQPERKWGNVDTWLIRRKMFAIFIVDDRGRTTDLWFKADPDRFLELTDRPAFRPAPYLARAGWVAVAQPRGLPLTEGRALLECSYRLVVAGLSQRVQRELGFEPARPARPARLRAPRLERPRDPAARGVGAGALAPSPRAPAKPGSRPAPLITRTTPRLVASGE
jgi:predicted DNA-binding protein (MmcQ/YjbR family)